MNLCIEVDTSTVGIVYGIKLMR